ncbi:hypothetical protein ACIBK8_29735 [Streptomyces sp. NPDC050161]|uniref:hypothetical protein n=1 Tax=Streptomyces sp. NPDC050161 TaxID=3365604 RepID=UPI0037906B64
MDQGIAALLGATLGVLGTVLASTVNNWSNRQQVQAQLQAEKAQWHRQTRRDAYSAFLAPAGEAQTALQAAGRAFVGTRDTPEIERRLRAAEDQLQNARATCAHVAIEGPETVERAARRVYTSLRSMQTNLMALADSPESTTHRNVGFLEHHAVEVAELSDRIREFTAVARDALSETGTHQ